ncbi:putative MFS family arabinose efflux permease [Nonomuraea thailandensis]|uniref:MFS family arabinose efflux permease n=1 Tax=Nonomuraea thailandensis TaxID=1188745 RepID=A0A9X2H0C1_9ACTN|nr:MFS transporter [Nonomuraea thailandensis]MCP2365041.1 putative MFS family arabinose efflux permease [Nonomuraea thailandensis]
MKGATFGEVFAVREFKVIFGSFVLLIAGDGIKMLALSVLVYERTGSPGLSAAAYMAGWLPFFLGGLFLLSLADRLSPRALMIAGELIRAVTCLLLAYAGLPVWGMLALVVATGLFSPVFFAARAAMLPEVLPGDAFVLGRSVLNVASAGAQIVGLAAGGAFLTFAGPPGALAVTAGLSVVAALVLRFGLPYRAARKAADQGAVRQTLQVNRRLLADGRVRGLLLAGWLPCVCLAGAEAMVVPYLGGQGQAGVVLAAAAGGMAVGEFVVGRFAAPALRERLSMPLAVLLGVPWLGFAASPGIGWAAALAAVGAAGLAYQLGLQRRFVDAVPEDVRGQAFGLQSAGLMTGQAVGAALIGGLGEVIAPGQAIAVSGAAGILVALALARVLRPAPDHVAAAPPAAPGDGASPRQEARRSRGG